MSLENVTEIARPGIREGDSHYRSFDPIRALQLLLGPLAGLLVWLAPLQLDSTAHKVLAIVTFMIVYWITHPVDHAVTAMIGCYLFWALGLTKFSAAFSGFASTSPWFIFGGMLMGEAASHSGLAKRLGFNVLSIFGTSYRGLSLGVTILSLLITFLVPSGTARVLVIAPVLIGIIAALGSDERKNVGRGLFLTLSMTSVLLDKMIMSGAAAILAQGIIKEQTGVEVLWSQWLIAYLPATVLTVFACWLLVLWICPAKQQDLSESEKYLRESVREMGPWSAEEKKVFVWILIAIAIWSTDSIHHIDPAVIGLGTGLILALPGIGVLDAKKIKSVNFLIIIFSAGALSLATVLTQTKALTVINGSLTEFLRNVMSHGSYSCAVIYWVGVVYQFVFPNSQSMLSSSLPLLLHAAQGMGYNPVALGLIWAFAGGMILFPFQSSVMVLGYSYGYFEAKDLLKLGTSLMVIEGFLLILLVSFYWPLIGMSWK